MPPDIFDRSTVLPSSQCLPIQTSRGVHVGAIQSIPVLTNSPKMKNRLPACIVAGSLALCIVGGLWAQTPKSDSSPQVPKAWRHLALEHQGKDVIGSADLARKIDSLGDEGWELVDVESISEAGTTTKVIFFFKHPK